MKKTPGTDRPSITLKTIDMAYYALLARDGGKTHLRGEVIAFEAEWDSEDFFTEGSNATLQLAFYRAGIRRTLLYKITGVPAAEARDFAKQVVSPEMIAHYSKTEKLESEIESLFDDLFRGGRYV